MTVSGEMPSASTVLMIRPAAFGWNEETARSNAFMTDGAPGEGVDFSLTALDEFEGFVSTLMEAGIRVIVIEDRKKPVCADAVFPNNWFSTHEDGTVVLYPMMAPSRRLERRMDVVESLQADHGFAVGEMVDLTGFEKQGEFLEGTGSMVLDHKNQACFACLSSRTHISPLRAFGEYFDYEICEFSGFDERGKSIYHTNVMMMIGEGFAVICDEAIRDRGERKRVMGLLAAGGREIVSITFAQMRSFAGNMLALHNNQGEHDLVLSTTAYECLHEDQVSCLSGFARLVVVPVPTIERISGGGVRCMLAEVFLPMRDGGEE